MNMQGTDTRVCVALRFYCTLQKHRQRTCSTIRATTRPWCLQLFVCRSARASSSGHAVMFTLIDYNRLWMLQMSLFFIRLFISELFGPWRVTSHIFKCLVCCWPVIQSTRYLLSYHINLLFFHQSSCRFIFSRLRNGLIDWLMWGVVLAVSWPEMSWDLI